MRCPRAPVSTCRVSNALLRTLLLCRTGRTDGSIIGDAPSQGDSRRGVVLLSGATHRGSLFAIRFGFAAERVGAGRVGPIVGVLADCPLQGEDCERMLLLQKCVVS